MTRLLSFLGAFVGGWGGWWIGERFGFGIAAFLSLVGTAGGIYFARRMANEYLDID